MSELIVGPNPVLECLRSDRVHLDALYLSPSASGPRIESLREAAEQRGTPIQSDLPPEVRERLEAADTRSSGGVVAVLGDWETLGLSDLLDRVSGDHPGRLLVLDQVQDPVNAGKLFRAAAFFGLDGVILPEDRTVPLSGTVLRTSSGGAARVPVSRVTNLRRALKTLKERRFWIVGSVPSGGRSPSEVPRERDLALVLGSEAAGMRRLTAESCDYQVTLSGSGDFDSLNVAAAGTVLAYELRAPEPPSGEGPDDPPG